MVHKMNICKITFNNVVCPAINKIKHKIKKLVLPVFHS